MPTDSPHSPALANNRPPSTYELLTQLTTGPSTREVATAILRSALKEQYPTLNIDPDLAMVVTPRRVVTADSVQSIEPYAESLTSVLARQTLAVKPVVYLDGEHFLSLQPDAHPAVHLPVKIDGIARLINELAGLLFTAFQEEQLNYWNTSSNNNGPRWQALSHSLRKVWNLTERDDWDAHDCSMARNLFHFPDKAERQAKDLYKSRAYLIGIEVRQRDQPVRSSMTGTAVLIGEHDRRPLILTHSVVNGYEKFDSLEQLGEQLPAWLNLQQSDMTLQWRLYEPSGNFFDHQACTLIELQIEAIDDLGMEDAGGPSVTSLPRPTMTRIIPGIEELTDDTLSSVRQIHSQLPDWMAGASDRDVSLYSRYVIDLAELQTQNHGRTFRDDIPPIRDYCRAQLRARIPTDKKGFHLNLDKVEISIESPVVWGSFVFPVANDITRRSLIDLALDNLTGLPTGQASVHYNGGPAPQWLSFNYLKGIIEALDIGKHYPALIKQKLLTDPVQSKARQRLYANQLRVQLPLMALQLKIQHKNGFDDLGYRYVAAVMQDHPHDRQVDGQEIYIRPLAFVPTLRTTPGQDVVTNMFVIGPKDHRAGPCVLYRPLLEPILAQYASRQNLIYAIKHQPELRESVLAWLPEQARFNYAQYVFPGKLPSPWTVAQALVEPETLLQMSGPLALSDETLGNDILATLFMANANAMVELATRQSVSNMQKRWDTLRQAGWRIFNAALPFFGRTVGMAAWIWQIMDDLQEVTEDAQTDYQATSWAAEADLLLNLGMALVLHVALRHPPTDVQRSKPSAEPPPVLTDKPEKPPRPRPTISVSRQPDLPDSERAPTHVGRLNISGAINRTPSSLAATLDSFKIDKPAGLGAQTKTPGAHLHLYPLTGKWYAPVAQRWFEVRLDDNDAVVIVDPLNPSRTGPLLLSNLAGQWFVDVRLRLRGGGFRNRRRAAQAQTPSRIQTLRNQITQFNTDENRQQQSMYDAYVALGTDAAPSTEERRQAYGSQVDNRLAEYEVPIRQLRALEIIDTVPDYQREMISYLNKQILLTRSVIDNRLPSFRNLLTTTLESLEQTALDDPQAQAASALVMSDRTLELIQRLEYVDSRFKELEGLGPEGAAIIQATMRLLPGITLPDLKAYRISLARYLCVGPGSDEAFTNARSQLNEIVEGIDVHLQSLLEILGTEADSTLDERIDALNSLLEQFAISDQRMLDLHAEQPQQVMREPLESLRQQLDEFSQRAAHNLAQLLKERKALEPKPGSSKAAQTPRRKIIKTRFNSVVVGEPRQTDSTLVDVKAPLTGRVIATFHEKTPGVWVERQRSEPRAPQSADLETSITAGRDVLREEPAATLRTLGHSKKPGRIPVEIEEMFHQYAARLERAVATIEAALTRLNLTESDRPSAATLNQQLSAAAERLYELGTQTRVGMTKQQAPTAARVEWLHGLGQVKITKVVSRRRLKGPGKNYLDEYEVRDHQTHQVLWYAHFHYRSPEAAVEDYVAGHLKTREQQKLGSLFRHTSLSEREEIAIYRSEISLPLAKKLFFAH